MSRVDSKEQKIDSFMHQTSLDKSIRVIMKEHRASSQGGDELDFSSPLRNQLLARNLNLASQNELKEEIEKNCARDMRALLQDMSFVGCLERELALVQHQTALYMINTQLLSEEMFYQLAVFNLGNLGYFRLEHSISLYELALMGLNDPDAEWTQSDGPKEKLAKRCAKYLNSKGF